LFPLRIDIYFQPWDYYHHRLLQQQMKE